MNNVPKAYRGFVDRYQDVAAAYREFGDTVHRAGPLDEKSRILVKLGAAIGFQQEGAVHSQVRKAVEADITPEEIRHTVLMAMTTIGFPATMAALTWVDDILGQE